MSIQMSEQMEGGKATKENKKWLKNITKQIFNRIQISELPARDDHTLLAPQVL